MAETTGDGISSGRYFSPGAYGDLPLAAAGSGLTVIGWFVWLDGKGPLLETCDRDLALVYDRDGLCAYRVKGVERSASLPTTWLRGRWIFIAFSKDESSVALQIDDAVVDRWSVEFPELSLGATHLMRDAVGFAADVAVFERRVPDERLQVLARIGREERQLKRG